MKDHGEKGASVLDDVVKALSSHCDDSISPLKRKMVAEPLPSRDAVIEATELVRSALFPGYYGDYQFSPGAMPHAIGTMLDRASRIFEEQMLRAFCFFCDNRRDACPSCPGLARERTRDFMKALPRVQRLLMTDVHAAYLGDPAATCPAETVFCYPGIFAITFQRIAHELYLLKVPLLPRIITEHAHSATGIDIHPGAAIGESFFIDHGTGVVIGETTSIGRNVRLYQGVTLGAKSFPLDKDGNPIKGVKRHPDVEDDVIVYAGATILGTVRVGKGSQIGSNVWLTRDVEPGSFIGQAAAKKS
ncbi:MAG: serine acetyltransferase [Elusimicrobia bacterium]|nr:serine acetyltransferase [Elusimicrobiota bacterium]